VILWIVTCETAFEALVRAILTAISPVHALQLLQLNELLTKEESIIKNYAVKQTGKLRKDGSSVARQKRSFVKFEVKVMMFGETSQGFYSQQVICWNVRELGPACETSN
jgi:hypothetical protein